MLEGMFVVVMLCQCLRRKVRRASCNLKEGKWQSSRSEALQYVAG